MTTHRYRILACLLSSLVVTACNGGSGGAGGGNTANTDCDPADPSTHDLCGTVLVGLTDADGDFLNYTVDVLSLTLETANGRTVETMPRSTRINFTDYIELTELLAAAAVPPATYVAGTIRLDYADAEIFVEAGGAAKKATVVDAAGSPLAERDVRIRLSDRDQLTVTRGRAALLSLDFDLEASHIVDVGPTPATAAAAPFILAEVQPVDEKDLRVRGPLVSVDHGASTYTVDIRPFNDRAGAFGRVTVHVDSGTAIEVDNVLYGPSDGLRALADAGPGTPTVAHGTLTPAERRFVAERVLAGSSVPGADFDAVVGNVTARDGDFLTLRGATLVPTDRRAHFHDEVVVEIGPETRVLRDGHGPADLDIDAISVGQRLTAYGTLAAAASDATTPGIFLDATAGGTRLHVTRVAGTVNTVLPGTADITLHTIDRRRAAVFDFDGTGATPEDDANPSNYTIATGTLTLPALAEGRPVAAWGFPEAFGAAPPDFNGRTVVDFSEVRSTLGIAWGPAGTLRPFLSIGDDGIVLDTANEDIGIRHYISQGSVLIDLLGLPSATTIVPTTAGRSLFTIATDDSLQQYSDFADFASALALSLDGATTARAMYARGRYDADSNTFTAGKIGIYLLEP